MREAILLFGGEADLELALKKALAPLRILVRTVPRERYSDSVGLLAGDKSCPAGERPFEGEELSQPLMLLAGFTGARMDQALNALRRAGVRVDYKAALTAANRTWDVPALYGEISREHQQMHQA